MRRLLSMYAFRHSVSVPGVHPNALNRCKGVDACSPARRFSRTAPRAAALVHLVHFGRRNTKDSCLDEAVAVYTKRMRGALTVEERWVRSPQEVVKLAQKMPVFALEVCARFLLINHSPLTFYEMQRDGWMPPDSVALSEWVYSNLQRGGSRLALVIGDENGVPNELLNQLPEQCTISLGPLTLTHKIARLVVVEQLYRALQIRRGTKYHK